MRTILPSWTSYALVATFIFLLSSCSKEEPETLYGEAVSTRPAFTRNGSKVALAACSNDDNQVYDGPVEARTGMPTRLAYG